MEYMIHSTARSRHTRAARAALPQNPRMKQYVGHEQRRLIRGQPIMVTEEVIQRNLAELRAKQASHMLEVRTRDGRLVDLETMALAPEAPAELKPKPRLDSVANDRNFKQPEGYKFVPPRGGDDATMPQLVKDGEKPALLKQAELLEPTPGEDGAPAVAATTAVAAPEEPPAPVVTNDAELDAALEAAQAEATEEPEPPAGNPEDVSSEEAPKRGRRSRR
jgi:hypothetical protein